MQEEERPIAKGAYQTHNRGDRRVLHKLCSLDADYVIQTVRLATLLLRSPSVSGERWSLPGFTSPSTVLQRALERERESVSEQLQYGFRMVPGNLHTLLCAAIHSVATRRLSATETSTMKTL